MTEPANSEQKVVRWYTAARRFPLLISKTPQGERIPGGPYTIYQLVLGALTIVVGFLTWNLWGVFGPLNIIVLGMVAFSVLIAARYIPMDAPNPLWTLLGVVMGLASLRGPRSEGVPAPRRRPTVVRTAVRHLTGPPDRQDPTHPRHRPSRLPAPPVERRDRPALVELDDIQRRLAAPREES